MIYRDYISESQAIKYEKHKHKMILLICGNNGTYANLVHCVGLTDQDLYIWSYQIASGMEFLSSKRVYVE